MKYLLLIPLISCTAAKQITLDGSKSYDPDGYVVRWYWKQIEGPKINFNSYMVRPIASLKKGVYKFELTVTDNDSLTGKDTVTITIKK